MTEHNLDNDLKYIRDKFEEDGLKVPASLSESAIRDMIAGQNPNGKKRRWVRPLIAVAACAALAICLVPAMKAILPGGPDDPAEPISMTADSSGLYQFRSYAELDQEMESLLPSEDSVAANGLFYSESREDLAESAPVMDAESADTYTDGAVPEDASLAAEPKGSDAGSAPEHSQTYTQVKDIDEADIVKTDGKYIYYLSSIENQIIIAKAANGKAKRVSAVGGSTEGSYIDDIYISGDTLIIIGAGESSLNKKGDTWVNVTDVTIYDITDRTAPKKLTEYSQTGTMLSSRLIGGSLCLITNDYVHSYRKNMNLPYVSFGGGTPEKLPIEDISCFPQVNEPSYTIIGLLDLTTGKASKDSVKTKAVLGGTDEIYCNGENLYVTGAIGTTSDNGSWQQKTQILKVSLADGKVKYKASAFVNGTVNNQWSMDERDGYFRVATTSEHDGEDVNNLFIFDEKMKQVGSVVGFAKDEHIEAVRYIKNKAYVITYRQTDPLFIIDLSDPTAPVIEGHVKISGFSTLLVPADSDHLLGLGFSTEENEFGEATNGVKLALFDISDPSHPKVADSEAFPDMSSPVQYDHKALLVGPSSSDSSDGSNADYYAIPYEIAPEWNEWDGREFDDDVTIEEDAETIDGDDVNIEEDVVTIEEDTEELPSEAMKEPAYGILLFSAKDGKLRILKELNTDESVNRCIYIGDYIYGICTDDTIEGFKVTSSH